MRRSSLKPVKIKIASAQRTGFAMTGDLVPFGKKGVCAVELLAMTVLDNCQVARFTSMDKNKKKEFNNRMNSMTFYFN